MASTRISIVTSRTTDNVHPLPLAYNALARFLRAELFRGPCDCYRRRLDRKLFYDKGPHQSWLG